MADDEKGKLRDPEHEKCECREFIGDNLWCPRHYPLTMEVPC